MSKRTAKHPQGHYCKVCGQHKPNEKYSGKSHAAHICKDCDRLSAAEKAEAMTMNRLINFPVGRLSAEQKKWLQNRVHDQRPDVAELAREVYHLHFPHAERNAMKKQLIINTLTFELHTEVFDEWGDEEMVNRLFTVDRKNRTIAMRDFDANGQEQTVTIDGGKLAKLLRWTVHTLEIFMWPEDYFLAPAGSDLDPDCFPALCPDDDFLEDMELAEDDLLAEEAVSERTELVGEPLWRVKIGYSNHTAQDIPCYNETLPPDRAEELYFALMEYFEPQEE